VSGTAGDVMGQADRTRRCIVAPASTAGKGHTRSQLGEHLGQSQNVGVDMDTDDGGSGARAHATLVELS
jgi:hypothetical protein